MSTSEVYCRVLLVDTMFVWKAERNVLHSHHHWGKKRMSTKPWKHNAQNIGISAWSYCMFESKIASCISKPRMTLTTSLPPPLQGAAYSAVPSVITSCVRMTSLSTRPAARSWRLRPINVSLQHHAPMSCHLVELSAVLGGAFLEAKHHYSLGQMHALTENRRHGNKQES